MNAQRRALALASQSLLATACLACATMAAGCEPDASETHEPGETPGPGGSTDPGGDPGGGGGNDDGNTGETFDPASQTGVVRDSEWRVCNTQEIVSNPQIEARVDGLLAPLTDDELDLYKKINAAREEAGLHAIPLSPTLTAVARTHAWDSNATESLDDGCNMHSWSQDIGVWTPFCYTADHAQMAQMHRKPRDLFGFEADGYENSSWAWPTNNASIAFEGWMNSSGHRDVILNQGIWASQDWHGIGIAIDREYAHLWVSACADGALFPRTR